MVEASLLVFESDARRKERRRRRGRRRGKSRASRVSNNNNYTLTKLSGIFIN